MPRKDPLTTVRRILLLFIIAVSIYAEWKEGSTGQHTPSTSNAALIGH
jgi:hypothetical protein